MGQARRRVRALAATEGLASGPAAEVRKRTPSPQIDIEQARIREPGLELGQRAAGAKHTRRPQQPDEDILAQSRVLDHARASQLSPRSEDAGDLLDRAGGIGEAVKTGEGDAEIK
jgi:hypothetical protein